MAATCCSLLTCLSTETLFGGDESSVSQQAVRGKDFTRRITCWFLRHWISLDNYQLLTNSTAMVSFSSLAFQTVKRPTSPVSFANSQNILARSAIRFIVRSG